MGFTVEDLLQIDSEYVEKMVLTGGREGIRKKIKGVTIIEAPDIVRFIEGGELLLTGLYAFSVCTLEEFKKSLIEIQKKNISGLIVKRGRHVENAEEKIELLKEFSEKYEVPLIEVPFEISFQAIMLLVMERVFNEEVARLKYYKTTHDNFTALSLSENYEENPVGDILDMLSKMIRNPVALFNRNLSCYATTDEDFTTFEMSEDMEKVNPGVFTNYKYMKQQGEKTHYVIQLNLNVGVKMYLVIEEVRSEVSLMDFIAVENAIIALQYVFSRKFAVSELEKRYQNDILNNILNGKPGSMQELKKSMDLLGMDINGYYRVCVFGVEDESMMHKDVNAKLRNAKLRNINFLEDAISRQFPEAKAHKDMEKVAVICSVVPDLPQAEYRRELELMPEKVQGVMTAQNKHLRVTAGVGKIVQGIVRVSESYKEANDAYSFVDIAGEVSEDGNSQIMLFSDLGIFRLLCQMENPQMLLEYVPESLQKLYNYKKPQQEDLMITLKTYLDYNQNMSKTAQDLYVHYKTAAYRIEKIAKITGMDFDNANEMLAVRIGLVIYKMIENYRKK